MGKKRILIFAGLFICFVSIVIPITYFLLTNPTCPPGFARRCGRVTPSTSREILSPIPPQRNLPAQVLAAQTSKKVFGFLPFWNLEDETGENLKNVDIVYYFSLTIKGDGNFDKFEPGYQRLGQIKKYNRKFGITLANMDQDDIVTAISTAANRKRIIDNTIKLIRENNFLSYDVNLDFEYMGTPSKTMTANYNTLVPDLAAAVHEKGGTLSVATLSDAVWKDRLYDIKTISQKADYIIVMAYDFTRLNSIAAGPVAPLFGKEHFEYDVYTTVTDYLSQSNPQKIVLGVPFYGYEWPVVNAQPNAFVLGVSTTGPEVSSYKRTRETIVQNNATVNFDDYSKSPWFSYFDQDSRTWRQIWFENERSLGLKLDLVNQANLGGIAIWALGYEGSATNSSHPLWETIKEKIK